MLLERCPRLRRSLETVGARIDLQHLKPDIAFLELEEDEKRWQLREFCTGMIVAVKHPSDHLQELDVHFSKLLLNALTADASSASSESIIGNNGCAKNAENILRRFPRVPQRLFTLPFNNSKVAARHGTVWDGIKDGRWAEQYLIPEARSSVCMQEQKDPESVLELLENMQDTAWDGLFVTSFIDTNTIVFLLKVADLGHQPCLDFAQRFQSYVNLLGELIDEYDALIDAARLGFQVPFQDPAVSVQALKEALFPTEPGDHEQSLSILKAFLWAAWQRSVMLYFYYVVGVQLWEGASTTWSSLFAIRGIRRLIDLEAQDYRGDSTQYLCNWAFELLRTTRTSLKLDFRCMISLFDHHFQGMDGRCIKDSTVTCRGDLPESCQRFTGADAKSQSMHAATCDGQCSRILWNESSYRDCESPRAVRVHGSHDRLSYCKASSATMAISHVWSHGQGGRPEDGVNTCLHKRYCRLAESFGCDSYWIDSTCIPDDEVLRKAAIMSINDIFCDSRVTLISDKDLQSKDLASRSIEDLETLLSILLVCDWGVRAWTMLEAIRGSESIHILCAHDQTIQLMDLLRTVHSEGAVDLAVLLGSAQHLLPSARSGSGVPIEDVGQLLGQRHASRKNDEIIIWGLLSNLRAPADILQFWKDNTYISTAFLISSAPRLEISPYGWAPETPYIRPQQRQVQLGGHAMHRYSVRYPSYDGRGSYTALITTQGLKSLWLVHDLHPQLVSDLWEACVEEMIPSQWTDQDVEEPPTTGESDADSKLYERPDYANACQILKGFASVPSTRLRVIRPLSKDGTSPYQGNTDRGEDFSILVAVCVIVESKYDSTDSSESKTSDCDKWHWKGVYEWIDDTHPDWRIEEMLII